MKKWYILLLLVLCATGTVCSARTAHTVYDLTCENKKDPVPVAVQSPRFSWKIAADSRNFVQKAWQILVADSEQALQQNRGTVWNSGKVRSSQSVLVPFGGRPLEAGKTYFWKVRVWDAKGKVSPWSLPARLTAGLYEESDWKGAVWIAFEEDQKDMLFPMGVHWRGKQYQEFRKIFPVDQKKIGMYRMPMFRKEFQLRKPLARAVVHVSGLGHFDLFLNGHKVGDHFLDPGWSKYDKTVSYVSFDLTSQLQAGRNALGVMLGNGFFNVPQERYKKYVGSFGAPRLIMDLRLEYEDGTVEDLVTDPSWKVTQSPVTFSSIYGGEDYDQALEQPGWAEPGFDDSSWQNAIDTGWKIPLKAQISEPLKVRDRISLVRRFKNAKGRWVYDFGQNFSGYIQVEMQMKGRQNVKFHPAELLEEDNSIHQGHSGSPVWFAYRSAGAGQVSWHPQFTYYGFRYVEVEGAVPYGEDNPDHLPEILNMEACHTCNSAPEVGHFECSKPIFNQIYQLIDWAVRSNMAHVLTDCPHREKLGWLEETYLMQNAVQYRYNLATLYQNLMDNMRQSQSENGHMPSIAPEYVLFIDDMRDTPEWGSAFVISPWYIWKSYGDDSLIREYYPDMQRYVAYLGSKADHHILSYGLGDWYDIGPKRPGPSQLTTNGVSATATYYYDVILLSRMAALLGKTEDRLHYENLAADIKAAFNERFWHPETQTYDRNSQTANAVAYALGLTTPENHDRVLQNLVEEIRGRDNALTAGDVGYRYVLQALEKGGASDVIYDMNSRYDVPGYGWQLAHGATALTESWQAYGFQSNNHFMLGHLLDWLFSGLGGIRQTDASVGFQHLDLHPSPVGDVRYARTSYESPYGTVVCNWKKENGKFILTVQVPANSRATVHLDTLSVEDITESGLSLASLDDSRLTRTANGILVEVGSGIYRFEYPIL